MKRRKTARTLAFAVLTALAMTATAFGQRIWVGGGFDRGGWRIPSKWASIEDFDGSFNYCRGFFTSDRREAGGSGWNTDYPGSDNNFSVRLAELTRVHVKLDATGQPDHVVVALTDPLLAHCPVLYMEDVGTIHFSEAEVQALRAYLLKGGYLSADDFWGTEAWNQWVREISRVLPPAEYPIFDIPPGHPILHALYDVKEVLQVSSIQFWRQSGGQVSERGSDSPHPNYRAIADERGRIMVVMAHNTDIPDTWEREGEDRDYFDLFSPRGYAIGVNTIIYGLTH